MVNESPKQKAFHDVLCSDLLREAGAGLRCGVWWAGLWLHGNQLHLVALATQAIR